MRRIGRIVLIVFGVVAALCILGFVGLAWLIAIPHTPDLSATKAAEIISTTPEFIVLILLVPSAVSVERSTPLRIAATPPS